MVKAFRSRRPDALEPRTHRALKFRRAVAALKNLPWRLGRQVGDVLFHAIASPVPAARTLDKSTNKQARKVLRPYTKRIGVEQGDGGGVK